MNYYFNPNYKLIEDTNKVILLARYSFLRKYPDFEGDTMFQTFIHPFYAAMLSFFDGRSLGIIYNDIAESFDIPLNSVANQMDKLINNKQEQYLEFDKSTVVFPSYTIIKTDRVIQDYDIYDPHSFMTNENIDIKPGRTFKPIDLTLMLNSKCHTNCIYCYADRRNSIDCTIGEDRLDEIIDEAKFLNMRAFDLIGGEVFLYKNWFELMKKLTLNGFPPFVSTKLPLKEEDIEKLNELNLPEIQFSLDAFTPYELERLLRVGGETYINKVIAMFDLFDKYNMNVTVHTILTSQNSTIDNLKRVYEFLKKHNISIWKIDFAQKSLFSSVPFDEIKVGINQMEVCSNYMRKLAQIENIMDIQFSDMVGQKQSGLIKTRDNFLYNEARSCPANVSSFFILPDGKVTICEQFYWEEKYIIGDVNKNSLVEIWNSDKALELFNRRSFIQNKKSSCYNCPDIQFCHSNSLVCLRDVVYSYGFDNWDFPDPRCSRAEKPYFELL